MVKENKEKLAKISPISHLKFGVQDLLRNNEIVRKFLGGRIDQVQTARYSDIGANDIPIIVVQTPEEESVSVNNYPQIDRTTVKLIIEIFAYADNTTKIDDVAFECRQIVGSANWRVIAGKDFDDVRHRKTTTSFDTVGQKLVCIAMLEFHTYYDAEFNFADVAENLEGVSVQHGHIQ
jgi:hypothetical protein